MSALESDARGTPTGGAKVPSRGAQLRQPRIADLIASRLRSRIVNGEIADGKLLPKQDELLEEFEVSRPSLREALRILETEGLITVRRGNMGGAVVHAPKPEAAAFMMGLVLQAGQVPLSDLAEALGRLEPACAAACADRPDRARTAVPVLRAAIDDAAENIDNAMAFTQLAHRFHDELVGQCGNETLRLTVGTLVTLWSTQESAWAEGAEARHVFPDRPCAWRRCAPTANWSTLSSAATPTRQPGSRTSTWRPARSMCSVNRGGRACRSPRGATCPGGSSRPSGFEQPDRARGFASP